MTWMALWFLLAFAWFQLTRALGVSFSWLGILAAFTYRLYSAIPDCLARRIMLSAW